MSRFILFSKILSVFVRVRPWPSFPGSGMMDAWELDLRF